MGCLWSVKVLPDPPKKPCVLNRDSILTISNSELERWASGSPRSPYQSPRPTLSDNFNKKNISDPIEII